MIKPTETPWAIEDSANDCMIVVPRIEGATTQLIAKVYTGILYAEREANAEFIVRACNSHNALVEAMDGVIRVADRDTVEFRAAKAALALAREVPGHATVTPEQQSSSAKQSDTTPAKKTVIVGG